MAKTIFNSSQSSNPFKGLVYFIATGNATTTITVLASSALTILGSLTGVALAATLIGSMRKVEALILAAASNAIAGWRTPAALWWRGNVANAGGFNFNCVWFTATGMTNATHRCFVGMQAGVAAPTDVEPSTLVNMVGMGWDAADVNVQILHNDATGTATKVDLGSNFPVPSVDRSNVYDLRLIADPNGTGISYTVLNIVTGIASSGVLSTNLPVNNTFLGARLYASSGGTSALIGIGLGYISVTSP